jgi:N-hydroxyarylamine O-acetyltransferase
MDVTSYLMRIGQENLTALDFETLSTLQRNHLLHVPFENLDVIRNVEIPLDVQTYYEKIVENKRGGFCYELNGLFHWLLKSLGFQTNLISASVRSSDGSWSMEGSHAALIVELDQPYFVDVGFGDSARKPIPLTREPQTDVSGTYRIVPHNQNKYDLQRLREDENWVTKLRFSTTPRELTDFSEPCHFNQNSPDSHFTQRELATIATEEGRITFSDDHLTITHQGEKEEIPVPENEKGPILNKHFGIQF